VPADGRLALAKASTGVGGEFAAVGEGRAVADLGEDARRSVARSLDASSLPERAGQERLLDLGG